MLKYASTLSDYFLTLIMTIIMLFVKENQCTFKDITQHLKYVGAFIDTQLRLYGQIWTRSSFLSSSMTLRVLIEKEIQYP
jgi:hypothetical protein